MSEAEQVQKLLQGAKNVLLTANSRITVDMAACVVAFKKVLDAEGKKVHVVLDPSISPRVKGFFQRHNVEYKSSLPSLNYVITLDYGDGEIEKVSYDASDGKFNLYITPSKGAFDFDKVTYSQTGGRYDLLVAIGSQKFAWLGEIFRENESQFAQTGIVNIDINEENRKFGKVNVVRPEANSLSEVVFKLLQKDDGNLEFNALQALFEGMISKLHLLQRSKISATSSAIFSEMIQRGGNLGEALNSVYFSLPFSELQLNQRLMANVRMDQQAGVIWASASSFDISQCKVNPRSLRNGNKIIFNMSTAFKAAFVLYESEKAGVNGVIEVNDDSLDALEVGKEFKATGAGSYASFFAPKTDIADVEKKLLSSLARQLGVPAITPMPAVSGGQNNSNSNKGSGSKSANADNRSQGKTLAPPVIMSGGSQDSGKASIPTSVSGSGKEPGTPGTAGIPTPVSGNGDSNDHGFIAPPPVVSMDDTKTSQESLASKDSQTAGTPAQERKF